MTHRGLFESAMGFLNFYGKLRGSVNMNTQFELKLTLNIAL